MNTGAQLVMYMSGKYQMEKACFARDMGKPWQLPADASQELIWSGGHAKLESTGSDSIQRGKLPPQLPPTVVFVGAYAELPNLWIFEEKPETWTFVWNLNQ